MSSTAPTEVLRRLVADDPTSPRLTWYDDRWSPGERIELSAKVLANWVAKATNLLLEEVDADESTRVLLDLPTHWRAVYWALAAWSTGAEVFTSDTQPDETGYDVVVTTDPHTASRAHDGGALAILVTLPALARSSAVAVSTGVVDEARELATYGDVADPAGAPTCLELADPPWLRQEPARVWVSTTLMPSLLACVQAWSGAGSVVLGNLVGAAGSDDPDSDVLTARLTAERVTHHVT